ncbi:hypothetical protein H5410_020197, partial [Solanum commersonii]
ILTYALSCFQLRDGLYKEFTSLFSNYWWGEIKEKRKMHFENLDGYRCTKIQPLVTRKNRRRVTRLPGKNSSLQIHDEIE